MIRLIQEICLAESHVTLRLARPEFRATWLNGVPITAFNVTTVYVEEGVDRLDEKVLPSLSLINNFPSGSVSVSLLSCEYTPPRSKPQ